MISESSTTLVRRYAYAFLNNFADAVSEEDCARMKKAGKQLQENTSWQIFFEYSDISSQQQSHMVTLLLKHFDLTTALQPLGELLCVHRRMGLLPEILEKICELFFERNNLISFNISSTVVLTKDEQKELEHFLRKKSGKQVRCTCTIDKRLVAGIRAQGKSLLWEYSIAQKLREAQHMALNGNNS